MDGDLHATDGPRANLAGSQVLLLAADSEREKVDWMQAVLQARTAPACPTSRVVEIVVAGMFVPHEDEALSRVHEAARRSGMRNPSGSSQSPRLSRSGSANNGNGSTNNGSGSAGVGGTPRPASALEQIFSLAFGGDEGSGTPRGNALANPLRNL